jgi:hypothetical protein
MIKRSLVAVLLLCACPATARETPSALEQLIIKDACTDILHIYREGLDHTDPAKISSVFASDGVWAADNNLVVKGQAEIRKVWDGIAARPRPSVGVHALSNIRFKVEDARSATGSALVTMYRYNPDERDQITSLAPIMLVQIELSCINTNSGWRFQSLSLKAVSVTGYRHGEG